MRSGSQFRVWLPKFHPARKRLGRAFYVQVGSQGGACGYAERDLPLFRVWSEESEPGAEAAFLFCDAEGRVSLRASWRAD